MFIAPELETPVDGEEGEAEPEADAGDVLEVKWHCKSGLAANIQTLKKEFCEVRGLKPIKIFITGPPAAGKTYYGQQLAEHYNVPHVHVKKLIEEIENWNSEKEDEIYKRRGEKKAKRQEEERIRLEEEVKKKEEERKRREEAGELEDEAPADADHAKNPDEA